MDSEYRLRAMDTPGHTQAHLCLLLLKNRLPLCHFLPETPFLMQEWVIATMGVDPEILYETI